jgi:hypothetical protein
VSERERDEPGVPTFSCVNAILVVTPNESIFYICIKFDVRVVYGISNRLGKVGAKNLSMEAIKGEDIFNSEVEIVDVNDRDQRTKKTMTTSVAKPEGGGACSSTPTVTTFKNIFGSNNRGPRRRTAAVRICLKDVRTSCIFA